MAENKIQIMLEMLDKASPEFKKANAAVIKEVKGLETQTKTSTASMNNALTQSAKQFSAIRSSIIPLTITLGSIIAITREWAKVNANTSQAFNTLADGAKTLSQNIGSLLAPSIDGLAQMVTASMKHLTSFFDGVREAYAALFDKITFGTQYIVAFTTAISSGQGVFEAHNIAASIAAEAVEDMGTRFRETMTEVQEGYSQLAQAEQNLSELRRVLSDQDSLQKRVQTDEQIALLKFYEQNFRTAHQGMAALTVAVGKSIQTNLSSAISSIVLQTQSAREAFKQLGQAMIKTIVDFIAQKIVAFVLEKTLLAGTVNATSAAAGLIAAAWAPAAFLATVATLGGAAAQAPKSLAAAGAASTAIMTGISAGMKAGLSGGGGASSGRSIDVEVLSVYPQAKGGDYMVNKPTLFMAGEAGPERATFSPLDSSSGQFGDVNIFIQGGINPEGLGIAQMAEKLGFEFSRQVRVARG